MIDDPDWRRIPSLHALRAVESAVRLRSFTAAARALNVTPAAIAQHVRAVEADVGAALVVRDGRGLAVTAAGDALGRSLGEAFGQIARSVAAARGGRDGAPLRVTMTPGFARSWLMPRLGGFWAAHADIPVIIHSSLALADLVRDGLDLGIRFGDGRWPGVVADYLVSVTDLVVGAPALLAGRGAIDAAGMQALPWALQPDAPEDRTCLARLGVDPDRLVVRHFPTGELCIAAAVQGYGLAFASDRSVALEIAAGSLVAVASIRLDEFAYYTVTPPGPRRPELAKFLRWLRAEVATGTAR
jgi:LysR family glycine cleavage system transcriptional activator